MTIGQAARYALNAIPEFASKVLARSSGREIFYGFAVNRMKLADHGITNPKRAYFYKTAEAACFLIDVQWMAHIFLNSSRTVTVFIETKIKSHCILMLKLERKMLIAKRCPYMRDNFLPNDNPNAIYKLVKNPITWEYEREQVPAQDWLEAENLYVAKRNRPSQHSNYAIYADVEYAEGSKKRVPKRAGLTPLEYLRRYEPINAFALLCFGFASTHSVLSTVVPCFISKDSDFTVSNYMSSLASKIGRSILRRMARQRPGRRRRGRHPHAQPVERGDEEPAEPAPQVAANRVAAAVQDSTTSARSWRSTTTTCRTSSSPSKRASSTCCSAATASGPAPPR